MAEGLKYDYGEDAQVAEEHAEGLFRELRDNVAALADADDAVVQAEEELRRARHLSAEYRERRIPALMERMGMDKFSNSEFDVELDAKVHASLPSNDKDPERRAKALAWFMEHGHAALVKNEFTIPMGSGEAEQAQYMKDLLQSAGFEFDQKSTIHPQTLLAWVREQLREGGDVPTDLLGVHEQRLAKIKLKKR